MGFAPLPSIVPPHACETYTGRFVDVVNPQPDDIVIHDIAWSLSRQVRYAGHTLGDPYHIAQHACFVEFLLRHALSEECVLSTSLHRWLLQRGFHCGIEDTSTALIHALCHDNTEAYLVDLPSPVKRHPELREPYKKLENNLQSVINSALGLPSPRAVDEAAVTWADLMALQIEAAALMTSRGRGWAGDMPHFELSFLEFMPPILSWKDAYAQFLHRFLELKDEIENK